MQGFSAENDDGNTEKKERLATSHGGRSGLLAVQASERLLFPSNQRRDTSEPPSTARAYVGGLATVRASERLLLPSRRHNRDRKDSRVGTTRVRSFSNSSSESRGDPAADKAGKLEEGIRYLPVKAPFLCICRPGGITVYMNIHSSGVDLDMCISTGTSEISYDKILPWHATSCTRKGTRRRCIPSNTQPYGFHVYCMLLLLMLYCRCNRNHNLIADISYISAKRVLVRTTCSLWVASYGGPHDVRIVSCVRR